MRKIQLDVDLAQVLGNFLTHINGYIAVKTAILQQVLKGTETGADEASLRKEILKLELEQKKANAEAAIARAKAHTARLTYFRERYERSHEQRLGRRASDPPGLHEGTKPLEPGTQGEGPSSDDAGPLSHKIRGLDQVKLGDKAPSKAK